MDSGSAIPFIARYRKEAHSSIDDQTLRQIAERLKYLRSLEERWQEIKMALMEPEDLYRPFRLKRRTWATVANERGLEPLAQWLLLNQARSDVTAATKKYISEAVPDADSAPTGARDIIAETVSDDAALRKDLRTVLL